MLAATRSSRPSEVWADARRRGTPLGESLEAAIGVLSQELGEQSDAGAYLEREGEDGDVMLATAVKGEPLPEPVASPWVRVARDLRRGQ